VIPTHAIELPPILFEHPDQLAAVSFHGPPPKQYQDKQLGCSCSRSGGHHGPCAGPETALTRIVCI
jgi:hypothetical protein